MTSEKGLKIIKKPRKAACISDILKVKSNGLHFIESFDDIDPLLLHRNVHVGESNYLLRTYSKNDEDDDDGD